MRGLFLSAALAAFALAAPAGSSAQTYQMTLGAGETLLRVDAEGMIKVRPDTMTIIAGVVTTGRTAKEALNANNVLADRLMRAVWAQGVSQKDARTEELSVRPQFAKDREGDEDRRQITGYVATNKIELRLRELTRAGDIVDALFQAGANTVDGPHFKLEDDAAAARQLRAAAVAEAREQAESYAAALGMRVARVLRVSERDDFDREETGEGIVVTGSRIPHTPVQPGELTVRKRLWVDYALIALR